ncbi:ATP-binding protein [Kribbella sp. NPDC004536]|uniref:ATP-binding protein n=1 Tax=Kribbella sp. NPDC004536 TaxID=3364106 RepID=UPI0036A5E470
MTGRGAVLNQRLIRAGVTEREAEVLWLVAGRLRNREMADRLQVSVRTVESHISALLRKLEVTDRAELSELAAELRRTSQAGSTLPAPLTNLIGRQGETSEVSALVDAHRLVTLIGPAGVGKTRLALRVASARADSFRDGARSADLAPVEPQLVSDTLARVLHIAPQPGWSTRDALREVLGGMHCLLIVDNCDQVIAETAGIIADLLVAGGQSRILATSREPLGVPGEVVYPVQTLSVPTERDAFRAEAAKDFDAVQLFVDRAAAASPGFSFTDSVAPAVATLCKRLDGLPLAIELAASRVRSFGVAELVEHLDQRFELLSAGARTALPRHRTLRGAIDWSYELLDDEERACFDRLGVFPADFDYAAAQSVCDAPSVAGGVLSVLPKLVDKSLVSSVGHGRYRLLETVRMYAAERLATSNAQLEARQLHAAHYLVWAEQVGERLRSSDQLAWLDRLIAEQPNLRTALAHYISVDAPEPAWRWIAALQRFWDITGQRREAHDWIQRVLAISRPPATSAVVAGLAAASEILQPADAQIAFELANQAAQLAAGLDDISRARAARAVGMGSFWLQPELVLPSLHEALERFGNDHRWETAVTLQCLAQAGNELAEVLNTGQQSVALFREVGDSVFAANTLFILAQRSMQAGVADNVHEWLVESQALADAVGSEQDQMHALVGFAQLAWLQADRAHATEIMEKCLPTLRRLGDQRCAGRALYMLGDHARELGHLARAEDLLCSCIDAVTHAGQSFVLVEALEALAAVLFAQGNPQRAAILLGAAHTAREAASGRTWRLEVADEDLRGSLVEAMGKLAFENAFVAGATMGATEAIAPLPAASSRNTSASV